MLFVTFSNCFARFAVDCVLFLWHLSFLVFVVAASSVQYFLFYYFFLCLIVCYFAVANEKQAFLNKKTDIGNEGGRYYSRAESVA